MPDLCHTPPSAETVDLNWSDHSTYTPLDLAVGDSVSRTALSLVVVCACCCVHGDGAGQGISAGLPVQELTRFDAGMPVPDHTFFLILHP